jgi:hypothetical protein
VASPGGTGFYLVTDSTAQGTRYASGTGDIALQTPSGSEGRIVQNAHRATRIFDGKLFISSGSTTIGPGLAMVNPDVAGLPTASTATVYSLPTANFATTTGGNPEQFVLLDLNANGYNGTNLDTAYIADGTRGLQKWTYDGTAWSLAYTNATSGGLLGLDYAGLDGSNNPILYATNVGAGSTGNSLLKLIDNGVATTPFEVIANSPTNTYFRGVAVVPEPAAVAVVSLGALGLVARRRRA